MSNSKGTLSMKYKIPSWLYIYLYNMLKIAT